MGPTTAAAHRTLNFSLGFLTLMKTDDMSRIIGTFSGLGFFSILAHLLLIFFFFFCNVLPAVSGTLASPWNWLSLHSRDDDRKSFIPSASYVLLWFLVCVCDANQQNTIRSFSIKKSVVYCTYLSSFLDVRNCCRWLRHTSTFSSK